MSYPNRRGSGMAIKVSVLVVAIAAIAGILFYLSKTDVKTTKLKELPVAAVVQPTAQPEPVKEAEKPVYEEPKVDIRPEPLPDLNQSDVAVIAALKGLNINGLVEMVIPEEILRKFVRAVDAVETGKVVTDYRPIASPQGAFVADSFTVKVAGGEVGESQDVEQFRVSPKNYLRYTLFAQVVSMLDSDAAIATYKRFYPLLNTAYQEMGLNKGNFHSVLIRAIDLVLRAPDDNGDMILVHPKVYFEFADPALEKLPEVHKLMMRMGHDNASKIKASLKNIRIKLLQK